MYRRLQPRRHSRRSSGFNFEHLVFKAKWNFTHFAFALVFMVWIGAHALVDIRNTLHSVFAEPTHAAERAAPACLSPPALR